MSQNRGELESDERRQFLTKAGKFAAATPPAVTFLLSTTLTTDAVARSGGNGSTGGRPPWTPGPPPRVRQRGR
jgi:hypothetical protein